MTTMKKTENIMKWLVFAILIASLLTIFCPLYEYTYREETQIYYSYRDPYSSLSIITLLVPILSIVFLFTEFKGSKLFSFGFSFAYALTNIFTLILINRAVSSNDSDSYYTTTYSLKYGYYFVMIETILLLLAVLIAFIIYLINKHNETKEEVVTVNETATLPSQLDILKQRISILDELKANGILSETEYEQKRAEIIKEIKI